MSQLHAVNAHTHTQKTTHLHIAGKRVRLIETRNRYFRDIPQHFSEARTNALKCACVSRVSAPQDSILEHCLTVMRYAVEILHGEKNSIT